MTAAIIRDTRPYIKTTIFKRDKVEISRINVSTGNLYKIALDAWEYQSFLKSQKKDTSCLKGLSKEEINFVIKNIIPGEKKVRMFWCFSKKY